MSPDTAGTEAEPLSIAAVSAGIAGRIGAIPRLWLTGEILSTRQAAGSTWCELADPGSAGGRTRPPTLSCRVDSGQWSRLPAAPSAGSQITALAELAWWSSSSKVGATLTRLTLAGDGAILERIELLRRQLHAEGLTDPSRRKPLPRLPALIGLVTGAGSAAEADVTSRTLERWDQARFRTIHTAVQGPAAAREVTAALRALDSDPDVEVIVIARGGGSVSDLAPFSDETLARAAAAATTPVISAIGHEPDHPVLDDVADARAGTPTQAAALIVADVTGERRDLDAAAARALRAITARLDTHTTSLAGTASRPTLADPDAGLRAAARALAATGDRLASIIDIRMDSAEASLRTSVGTLTALSPAGTLARGYAIVRHADGRPLTRPAQLPDGTALSITTATARITATSTGASHRTPPSAGTTPGHAHQEDQ